MREDDSQNLNASFPPFFHFLGFDHTHDHLVLQLEETDLRGLGTAARSYYLEMIFRLLDGGEAIVQVRQHGSIWRFEEKKEAGRPAATADTFFLSVLC